MLSRLCILLVFSLGGAALTSSAQDIFRQSSPSSTIAKADSFALFKAKSEVKKLQNIPSGYFNKVSHKANKFNRRLTRRTAQALCYLQKQEEKISRKLQKTDSHVSDNVLVLSIDSLSHLKAILKGKSKKITHSLLTDIPGKHYTSYLDTLKNALHFLDKMHLPLSKYGQQMNRIQGMQQKIQSSLGSVQRLESRMQQLQQIQQYIGKQKQLLQDVFNQPAFSTILKGRYGDVLRKHLGKIGKEVYYYKAQLRNYKELWQHPDKLERKTLSILDNIPAFKGFMREHSALASLFNIAGSETGNLQEDLAGLQTRAMVQQELQQRLQSGGSDGQRRIQQEMARARQKLKELKNKLPGGVSTADMPNFKPKDLKSKAFFQRLEFSGNIQFSKPTRFSSISGIQIPTISDIAGQVAYKFSDKGSAGIGAAFKLGWGSNIRKIHFTAQGVGFRSFLDYKIKGTIYINGGFEMNYNKTIPRIPELKNLNGWTRSALLGIEKKYKISPSTGSGHRGWKGTMMLLFDFLYKQHIPQTQPLVFRVGYSF